MASIYDKSSLVLIPSGVKDGKLFSQKPTSGDGDFDFSRGSNLAATRVNADQLIEKGRENLLLQSNSFDTTWTKSDTSVTSGQSGYDGSSDAWLLDTTIANGFLRQEINFSGVSTFSIYAKAGTADGIYIELATSTYPNLKVDLSSKSFISSTSIIDYNIEDVGNGWSRVSFTISGSYIRVNIRAIDGSGSVIDGTLYIQSAQLESGLVATPYIPTTTTSAQAGILENTPRLDYSGGATCPSVLLEPSRTNLVTQSEYFGDSSWNDGGNVISDNSTTSPDGYVNASSLTPSATTGALRLYYTVTSTAAEYTWSVYAKANGNQFIQLLFGSALNSSVYSNFDLTNGTITQGSGGKIESVGSGWYRISISATLAAATNQLYVWNIDNGTSARGATSTGNGVDGTHLWGASLELGSYPTSYIPTYGTSVTRAADSCSKTGISNLIGQTEGTMFLEFEDLDYSEASISRGLSISDGTYTNRIYIAQLSGGGMYCVSSTGCEIQEATPIGRRGLLKVALAYKTNDYIMYVNGVSVGSDTSATVPACDSLFLGQEIGLTINTLYKPTNQAILFPTRLTNSELAALTTI